MKILKNIAIGLLVYILYLWYRAAMLLIITRPILTVDDWIGRDNKQDYWIMLTFAFTTIGLIYLSFWQVLAIYGILLFLNVIIWYLWKLKKNTL